MAAGELLVSLQTFLSNGEGVFPDKGRNGYLDPFLPGPLMRATVAGRKTATLAQEAVDLFPLGMLGLAEARRSLVGGVAEHCPHCRPFPEGFSLPGPNTPRVEPSRDLPYAQRFLCIPAIHVPYYYCLIFDDVVVGGGGFGLAVRARCPRAC